MSAHVYTRSLSHNIKDTPTPHKHRRRTTAGCVAALFALLGPRGRSKTSCTMPPPPKYLWTLRVGAPRIRLEERRRTCDAEHDGALLPQRTSFGARLRREGPENRSRRQETRNLFSRLSAERVCRCECAAVNVWMHDKHGYQAGYLQCASGYGPAFLLDERTHRST